MVGRIKEQMALRRALESPRSEFVAVYGRRRIGKTFLVRQTLGEDFLFSHSGLEKVGMVEQLRAWRSSLREAGCRDVPRLTNWMDAFDLLKDLVRQSSLRKKVIFIDEMPWMDTAKSSFLPAFEFFWNSWASARDDILLVICGSATSWIINKVLKSRGGLHNRVTVQIWLHPFTLRECRQFAQERKLELSKNDLAEAYMALGGVPYYWGLLVPGLSMAQNMDELFFAEDARLRLEFEQLYASLFKNPEPYLRIVTDLGRRGLGLTREQIAKDLDVDESGHLTRYLEELEQCGFIRRYHPFAAVKKGSVYQLTDCFTLFHFQFFKENARHDVHFWTNAFGSPVHRTWAGLAFERLCLQHVEEIKDALGIRGVVSDVCAWRDERTQVDLVIDRDDRLINLCEMRYSDAPYRVDADVEGEVRARRQSFYEGTGTVKAVHLTLVTPHGLLPGAHAGVFQSCVTLDDLLNR